MSSNAVSALTSLESLHKVRGIQASSLTYIRSVLVIRFVSIMNKLVLTPMLQNSKIMETSFS